MKRKFTMKDISVLASYMVVTSCVNSYEGVYSFYEYELKEFLEMKGITDFKLTYEIQDKLEEALYNYKEIIEVYFETDRDNNTYITIALYTDYCINFEEIEEEMF